jgi:hypothetical protein
MKIISLVVFNVFLCYNLFAQENLVFSEYKASYNFFENNGYLIEFDNLGFNIKKDGTIKFSNNIEGIKTINTSDNLNYSIISSFQKFVNKSFTLNNVYFFDKEYSLLYESIDTVYNDYYNNLYTINNKGQIICYDINSQLVTIKNNTEEEKISLPYYYSFKVEEQNFLSVDDNYVYIIRNISNPLEDEILPGFTIFYRINLLNCELSKIIIPINTITSYYMGNKYYIFSGLNGDMKRTIIYDENLNQKNETYEMYNFIYNYDNKFIGVKNRGIDLLIIDFKVINSINLESGIYKSDICKINDNLYLINCFLDKTKILRIDLNRNEFKLYTEKEFDTFDNLLKLNKVYLFSYKGTIVIN